MSRSRRALLTTLGVALGGSLAGCLAGGGEDEPRTGTDPDDFEPSVESPSATATDAVELVDHTFETSGGADPSRTV